MSKKSSSDETLCVSHPEASLEGFLGFSVPVYRASTIVYPDANAFRNRRTRGPEGYTYGLFGTPTSRSLERQISMLQKAEGTLIVPSGQAAITSVMLAFLRKNDHLLIPDNVYPPVKEFAKEFLTKFGIISEVFDPTNLADIQRRLRPGVTRLVWVESPGSTSLEVCDLHAISQQAHAAGAIVGCDNTWATALLCKPIQLGVDVVAEALTKYVGGHSDILLGSVSFRDRALYEQARQQVGSLGIGVSPDECSLALRGIETMALRLRHVGYVALTFARRLCGNPGISAVLHPALTNSVGHDLWQRDFASSTGVFTLLLEGVSNAVVDQALDSLKTFKIGFSWGGTHSLIVPADLGNERELMSVPTNAVHLRISIGLEDIDELWRDLENICELFAKNRRRSS
ncbi:trans-sulfuration enzyme family protein [Lonsdalea quercina]|uniref:trans-sulfuration enzyme family protein n=1 Tax=Lonsdalea quercina TaxID=71657 RepID=UPI003975F741